MSVCVRMCLSIMYCTDLSNTAAKIVIIFAKVIVTTAKSWLLFKGGIYCNVKLNFIITSTVLCSMAISSMTLM